jgi:hypothetical protein
MTRIEVWREMDREAIVYQFSRSKVERGDFSHFLNLYGADKLPTGRRLRELMDRFVFCVEGWDDDPREIHMIPEIRHFYSAFHDAWPYWLYFLQSAGGYASSHDALLHAFRHNNASRWTDAGEGHM